jgi:2-dehydro-3-deoxyphosphogluconate aldolase/(4S)-4-hydroxy-2-oxoglutarate aldolase
MEDTINRLRQEGIVAIIRGGYSSEQVLAIAGALIAGGVHVLEVTLNTPSALEAVPELLARFGDQALIGVGTVRVRAQFEAAYEAGAQFTVAPNFDAHIAAAALARDHLYLPGVLTPTEVQTAHAAGCRVLKLFPSDTLGPRYLKALRAPFDDVDFMPTGGVSIETMSAWRNAGAVAVGVGGSLVSGADQSLDAITTRAQAFRRAWDST